MAGFNFRKFLQTGTRYLNQYYQTQSDKVANRWVLENKMQQRRLDVAELTSRIQKDKAQEEYYKTQTQIELEKAQQKKNEGKFKEIKGGDGFYYLFNDNTGEQIPTGIKVPKKDLENIGGDKTGSAEAERNRARYLELLQKEKIGKISEVEKEEITLLRQRLGLAMSPEEKTKQIFNQSNNPYNSKTPEQLRSDIEHADSLGQGLIPPIPADTTTATPDTSTGFLGNAADAVLNFFGGRKTNAQKELENQQYDKYWGQ